MLRGHGNALGVHDLLSTDANGWCLELDSRDVPAWECYNMDYMPVTSRVLHGCHTCVRYSLLHARRLFSCKHTVVTLLQGASAVSVSCLRECSTTDSKPGRERGRAP
jgi:hypothetical protein